MDKGVVRGQVLTGTRSERRGSVTSDQFQWGSYVPRLVIDRLRPTRRRRHRSRRNRRHTVALPVRRTRNMYPSIARISYAKALNDKPSCYKVPDTKLRNVICIFCKSKFYVPGKCRNLRCRDVALSIRAPAR